MTRGAKCCKPLVHSFFITLLIYFISIRSTKIITIKKVLRFLQDMRYILLWTKTPGLAIDGQDIFTNHKCQHFNCYITSNRSFFNNLGHFDAILFNLQDISAGSHDLPEIRSWSQKYIFFANDSSDNYPVCDPVYDTFFNWTWTYKQDSTIFYRYITLRNIDDEILSSRFKWVTNMKPATMLVKSQLTTKSKAVAIFLDKCESRSEREVYIKNLQQELSKYNLTVDIFGECGTQKCKRKTMANCFWRLKHQYYFYLAMEDSFAVDYLTGEVLYAYNNYAVPIVYGGAAYAQILPPNSYLSAVQLSEEMLATAINKAVKNESLYHNFFRWRNHYIIKSSIPVQRSINVDIPVWTFLFTLFYWYSSTGLKCCGIMCGLYYYITKCKAPGPEPCSLCKALNNAHWLGFHTKLMLFRKWWNPFYKQRCNKNLFMPFY